MANSPLAHGRGFTFLSTVRARTAAASSCTWPASESRLTVESILLHFRRRRMRRFAREFGVTSETRILDVGGTPFNWLLLDVRPRVTIVNMPRAGEAVDTRFQCM